MVPFSIINPYTNKIIESHNYESLSNIEEKVIKLTDAYREWKTSTIDTKKKVIQSIGDQLSKQKNDIAHIISADMGKPIKEAMSEVNKCIDCCNHFSSIAKDIEKKMIEKNGIREPLGIILGIMPWNYPLWQLMRYVIPCLIVGNTCLIKPAYNTFRIANKLHQCLNNIDLIDVCMPTNEDTETLITHPNIAGVSFTGSVMAGKRVGGLATQHLKPCVLELGGSDPFIVFKDANLNHTIDQAIKAKFTNAGQVCIAAKRFLFESSIYENAISLYKEKAIKHLKYGDPLNTKTTIGPLARIDIKNKLTLQLNNANLNKDTIIYEYTTKEPLGNYFPPMIINAQNLDKENTLLSEEIFGPIAVCDSFKSTTEAIEKANQSDFGLGASIWTNNKTTIKKCTKNIECGTIAINTNVHSSFDTPFGGRKQSGLGLELGIEGALSFTGYKAILKK